MKKCTFDFETQSEADLKKIGAYEYSMHPTTIALCMSFKFNDDPKVYRLNYEHMQIPYGLLPIQFRSKWVKAIENYLMSAHNAFFERCIYTNVLVRRFKWPPIPPQKIRCTAAKAATVAIPRKLQGACEVMQTPIQKDLDGHRVMMKLCKPTSKWRNWKKLKDKFDLLDQAYEVPEPQKFWTPETAPEDFKILYRYCDLDVLSEEKLDEALPDLIPFEQELWHYDQKINWRGINVDIPVVSKIADIMDAEAKIMSKELDTLTMGLVSSGTARDRILEFLALEGIEMPNLRAKTVDEFLENGKVTGDAAALLKIRKALAKSSTAKYKTFQRCSASDGRVRDTLLYHAASTGRWGGQKIQPQNFPRGIIKDIDQAINFIMTSSVDDLKMLYGENLMPLFSSVLRGMFIATKGYELFVEDYNAIETRITFWLAEHEAGLDMFRQDIDLYKMQASEIYKKSILEITDTERQVGKAAVLGCGYQMGPKKFSSAASDVYRVNIPLDLAKVAVTAYRELHYPVVEMWSNYQNAAIFAIEHPGAVYKANKVRFCVKNNFLILELPGGKRIYYKSPSVVIEKVEIKDDEGNITNTFMAKKIKYWAVNSLTKKWNSEATYGGKLTENIVQSVSRNLLAEAIIRAEKSGYNVLMHSHDELVSERKIGEGSTAEYRKIMETLPTWAEGLPIKASGWSGFRYKKG